MARRGDQAALVYFERGLCLPFPDLKRIPAALFPVWGDYCFLDVVKALRGDSIQAALLLAPGFEDVSGPATTRWDGADLALLPFGRSRETLIHAVGKVQGDVVFLGPLCDLAVFDASDALRRFAGMPRDTVVKLSISRTPCDLFMLSKRKLLQLLKAPDNRAYLDQEPSSGVLERLLHNEFRAMEDLEGRILFQHDLTRFYSEQLLFAGAASEPPFLPWRGRMEPARADAAPSVVTATGEVIHSYIAAGCEVSGRVVNSILFPGVSVGRGAEVKDSVIMNDNHIGAQCTLRRTLVLPNRKEALRSSVNIQAKARIGGPGRDVRNDRFPGQVYDGIVVLGPGVEVPGGVVIEEGVYLGAGYPPSALRRTRTVPRGAALIQK